ncbi:MAG: DUF2784 domain-containing protein [Caldisericaceae bacterium]|nr:DUF2784 domain-containing protein [Caldisericaceae bacterium]
MIYKILADTIVIIHFAWILFMLIGFIVTLCSFSKKKFWDRWLFRTIHLFGIVYVSSLAIMRKDCPLTLLENALRAKYNSALIYPGSFMVYYVEKFVYPDVNLFLILIPTAFIAIFSIAIFIIKPPAKIKLIFKQIKSIF